MTNRSRLLFYVGAASPIVTAASLGMAFIVVRFLGTAPRGAEQAAGLGLTFLPAGVAAWWIYRKLQPIYSPRVARTVAIAYAAVTPVALSISMVLAPFGAFVFDGRFQSRILLLAGLFLTVATITTLLCFAVCAFALWSAAHDIRSGQPE